MPMDSGPSWPACCTWIEPNGVSTCTSLPDASCTLMLRAKKIAAHHQQIAKPEETSSPASRVFPPAGDLGPACRACIGNVDHGSFS